MKESPEDREIKRNRGGGYKNVEIRKRLKERMGRRGQDKMVEWRW